MNEKMINIKKSLCLWETVMISQNKYKRSEVHILEVGRRERKKFLNNWKLFYCGKIHKSYCNYFKVYSIVALNAFTLFCNYHHHLSPEPFSSWNIETLHSLKNSSPFPLPLIPNNQNSTFFINVTTMGNLV